MNQLTKGVVIASTLVAALVELYLATSLIYDPLLPMAITLVALGATLRRLVAPLAWPLGIALFLATTV